jgi:peptide/nickel transport system ATP-binding protein
MTIALDAIRPAATTTAPLVRVTGLSRTFDVSKPWLNRVIEREPRLLLKAVQEVTFDIPKRQTFALVGESGSGCCRHRRAR